MGPKVNEGLVVERCTDISLGEMLLMRRGEHYEIIFNGVFLMASYGGESEREMVRLVLEGINRKNYSAGLRLLIGGLGMGFSLQEALTSYAVAEVVVVEVAPLVVEWNRNYFADLNGKALTAPRTTLVLDDLCHYVEVSANQSYDGIILDIDNGPDGLVLASNRKLYSRSMLNRLYDILRPGGCLALWSWAPSADLGWVLSALFAKHRMEMVDDAYIYIAEK